MPRPTNEQKLVQAGRILAFRLQELAGDDPRALEAVALWENVCRSVRPAPQLPQTIGTCGWCGCTDHHLVRGECPTCHEKVRQMPELPRNHTPVLTEDL
ncbi:MAG TPA: hypothetical protein VFA86_06520 [Gammaproteobacteria bacterium]|nr:hypothetical protein [Gammaproteobacteria bacterium]